MRWMKKGLFLYLLLLFLMGQSVYAEEMEVMEEQLEIVDIETIEEVPEEMTDVMEETAAHDTYGWVQEGDDLKYQNEDGTFVTDQWQKIGKYRFLFDENGNVLTGWNVIDGQTFYLKKTGEAGIKGAMLRGWQNIGGSTYYFKKSGEKEGVMFSGVKNIGNYRYCFDSKGALLLGWQTVNGKTYFLNESGAKGVKGRMYLGWQTINKKVYYFKESGSGKGEMLKGWQKIGSRTFFFKRTGEHGVKGQMFTDWKSIDHKKYFFKRTGAYGAKGAMLRGWQNIDKKRYYFDSNGVYVPNKKAYKVAIDAGHQRKGDLTKEPNGPGSSTMKAKVTYGAEGTWTGQEEYELNLSVAKKLEAILKERGYDVYMIRTHHDVNISNSQRAKMAANAGADILIRIHANSSSSSSSVNGALTVAPTNQNRYLTKNNIAASQKLSQKVLDHFCAATGAKNRGVWCVDTMSGINWSTIPVTIMEMGYLSNYNEDQLMATDSYRNKMAKGMANGIDEYFK